MQIDKYWQKRYQAVSSTFMKNTMQWAAQHDPDYITIAADELGIPFDPYSPDTDLYFMSSWALMDFLGVEIEDEDLSITAFEGFLNSLDKPLNSVEEEVADAILLSQWRFYEVLETDSHSGAIKMIDVYSGDEVIVADNNLARNFDYQNASLIFCRVLRLSRVNVVEGNARMGVPLRAKLDILKIKSQFEAEFKRLSRSKKQSLIMESLIDDEVDSALMNLFLSYQNAMTNGPKLINTDGDEMIVQSLNFSYKSLSFEDVCTKLASLAEVLMPKEELFKQITGSPGTRSLEIPWAKKGNPKHSTWDNTILAHLEVLEPSTINAQLNSNERSAALVAELEKRLGTNVNLENIKIHEQPSMAELRAQAAKPKLKEAPTPEMQEVIAQAAEKHWEAWIHNPLPALDGLSPLEASKDPEKKLWLILILEEFQRQSRPDNLYSPPIKELRERLNI